MFVEGYSFTFILKDKLPYTTNEGHCNISSGLRAREVGSFFRICPIVPRI